MKKDKINNPLSLLMLLAFVILIFAPPAYSNNEDKAKAEKLYNEGMNAVNKGNWGLALQNFKNSYQLFPHSTTAYLICCAYLKQEDPSNAEKFAEKAITEKPELEEPFLTDANKIRDWAKNAKGDAYYLLKGKADESKRPKKPKIKPPRPAVPQQKALSGEKFIKVKPIKAVFKQPINLTGKWNCNDGGSYFIRQIDNELWWYGQSKDNGKTWSNVFHGHIKGNQIKGKWVDVPQGLTKNSGEIILEILGNSKLKTIEKTGGFGGTEWTR